MNNDPTHFTKEDILHLIEELRIKDLLLDSGTEAIVMTENGKVLFTNSRLAKMLGYNDPKQLMGESIRKFVAPRSKELVMANIRNNVLLPYESFSLKKDGTEFPTRTFVREAQFHQRKVRIITIQDITDFYNSRKMLEKSETSYRTLLNQIPVTIWEEDASELLKFSNELGLENIVDLDSYLDNNPDIIYELISKVRIINVNETALDLLNVRDKETLIKSLPQYFTPKSQVAFKQVIIAITEKKTYFESESEFRKTNGEKIDIRFIWSVAPGHEETYTKIISIIFDITSKKKIEKERKELESRFEHMLKLESLGTFASGIANDYNNMLVGILGNTSLALSQIDSTSPIVELLREIEEISKKASNLTKQLQAYSASGKVSKELFNLNDMIEGMQDFIKLTIPNKIEIITNLSTTDPWIEADKVQVGQIVINLLLNAGESMNEKGIITIRTFHITKESIDNQSGLMIFHPIDSTFYSCIEIIDSGSGIDNKNIHKNFDPFYSSKSKGRGLGLSVVQGIVTRHEGGLILDTKLNEGTSFKILFPLSVDYKSVKKYEKSKIKESTSIPEGKIMVVDDEPFVLSVVSKFLKNMGFDAISAKDGTSANRLFQENPDIKLVILDLTLKTMVGQQLFEELRNLNPKLPIIISGGFDKNELFYQFEGVERLGFLQKPYSIDELKQIILSMI